MSTERWSGRLQYPHRHAVASVNLSFAATALTGVLLTLAATLSERALIGVPGVHRVQAEDTLPAIARRYDVGFVELRLANPGVDPWLPPAGRLLQLPTQHLLPAAPRRGIVINLAELRLYAFGDGSQAPRSFPIGIGRDGWETPQGATTIARRKVDPDWVPTASERAENPKLPLRVAPGPDNPMGRLALYLARPGYAIHGTNRPDSVGRRGSHGCIRLYPEDIETLYAMTPIGTPVLIVDQRIKLGWHEGALYLEVHPPQWFADAVEAGRTPSPSLAPDVEERVLSAAGAETVRVDWRAVQAAAQAQDGMPLRITRP